jgi:hypothetical protein
MVAAHGILLNGPADIYYSGSSASGLAPWIRDSIVSDIKIKWHDGMNYDYFPNKMKMAYFPYIGKIVFYNGDKIYGVIYKNGALEV